MTICSGDGEKLYKNITGLLFAYGAFAKKRNNNKKQKK